MRRKYSVITGLIVFVLFLVPFFWLSPGQLDIGGDSSRLYFYNPVEYLKSTTLYGISASSFGHENINYIGLPFVGMLALLRAFLTPTMLISLFHGLVLALAFLFTYLSIQKLIKHDAQSKHVWIPSIAGGLLYALSPVYLHGWQYVLITYYQIFLNPLMFYLMLQYFMSSNFAYISIALIVSVLFSPNFSVIAAPPLLAFYPVSILFLLTYTKYVCKKRIVWWHIGIWIVLFVFLHAFHLVPQISGIFSKDAGLNATIFSSGGKYGRGLSYFLGIAPNIKASINLLGQAQMTELGGFVWLFIVFPFVMLFSYVYNKKRTLPLLTVFFLFVLFFATANITEAGFSFYRRLFDIPGFSMFRNFYGQWQYTYAYYYSLLFGIAFSLFLASAKRTHARILAIACIGIIVVNAWPFLRGEVLKRSLWQSEHVSPVIRMDPSYEEMMKYIRNLTVEGKVATFPLTDPGYQVLGGEFGGAYVGPSTISYLSEHQDFSGHEEYWNYKDFVLDFIKTEQYEMLKKLFGMLNIKYVFYNADPVVYDKFPAFPYIHVRKFAPESQNAYRKFIDSLALKEVARFGEQYYLYELPDQYYLPQIYAARTATYLKQHPIDVEIPLSWDIATNDTAFYVSTPLANDPDITFDEKQYVLSNSSTYLDFFKNTEDTRLPWGYVSHRLDSFLYPFIIWRENRSLARLPVVDDVYIERSILFAEKRVNELLKFDKGIKFIGDISSIVSYANTWKEPSLVEALQKPVYNYWEVSLARYFRTMSLLIDQVSKTKHSAYPVTTNKALIDRMFILHKDRLFGAISGSKELNKEQQQYLATLSIEMFEALSELLDLQAPSLHTVSYSLEGISEGLYDVLIQKDSIDQSNLDKWEIQKGKTVIPSSQFTIQGDWLVYKDFFYNKKDGDPFSIIIPTPLNLIRGNQWELVNQNNTVTATSEEVDTVKLSFSNGLNWKMETLAPRSYYVLSFDYDTKGKDFRFNWFEKEVGKSTPQKIASRELWSDAEKTFSFVIHTGAYTDSGFIQITKTGANTLIDSLGSELTQDAITIKNLSFVQVPSPTIIWRQRQEKTEVGVHPRVSFQKINPTKYRVSVSFVEKPFALVLAQKYDAKWKLVDVNTPVSTVGARIGQFCATLLKWFVGLGLRTFQKEQSLENTWKNVFIDANTFETWEKQMIDKRRHFEANGYANAWYILPSDLHGKTEYTFVIEMDTQRIFYSSLVVSLITLVLCFVVLIRAYIHTTSR